MASVVWDTNNSGFQGSGWHGIESPIPKGRNHAGGTKSSAPKRDNERRTQYVKYVPVGFQDTHAKAVGYLFWLFGFTGSHRFYYGKPVSGTIWFFTLGLFGIGWLVDFFLIPGMDREADFRYQEGPIEYSLVWLLLMIGGVLGLHRFAQSRWITGIIWFFTLGLFGIGFVYDLMTLNSQIDRRNRSMVSVW